MVPITFNDRVLHLRAIRLERCAASDWNTCARSLESACRHGHIVRATKPRSKLGSKLSGDGFWRVCATAASSRSLPSLLVELNDRPLQCWGRSRRELFEELDHPALIPLPDAPYEYAEWKRCRVNLDYHVEITKHYYGVPQTSCIRRSRLA